MARRKDYQQLCKGVQRLAAASVVRIMKHFSKKSSLISSLEKPENLRYFQDSKRQRRRGAGDTLLSLLPPRKKNYVSSSSTTVMMLGTPLVLWWTWPQANRLICAIGLNRQGMRCSGGQLYYHRGQTFFFSKNPKTFMMVGSLGNCWLYQEKSKVTTSRFFKSQIVLRCARLFATRRQSSIEEIVEKELHMTSPTPCRLMDLGVRPSARLFTKIFSDKWFFILFCHFGLCNGEEGAKNL